MKRALAGLIAVAAVLLTSACGSSGGESGSSDTPSDGGSTSSASGGTLKIVMIDDASDTLKYADVDAAVKAVVKSVNAAGGIKGHQLVWSTCETKGDDNEAAKCARSAANDKSVVAVVGEESEAGAAIDPILESSNLPSIGIFPLAANDYSSPMSFPITAGPNGINVGSVLYATSTLKATEIGLAYADSPAGAGLQKVLEPVAEANGAKITANTAIPVTAPDFSSYVQASASKTDAVVLAMPAAGVVKFAQSAAQQGVKTPILTADNLDKTLIPQLPNGGAGIVFTDIFQRTGPVWKKYTDEIGAVDATQAGSLRAINTWLAGQVFIKVAQSATSLDRAGILSALKGSTNLDLGGVLPPLNFSKDVPGQFPRMFNDTVTYNKMVDGQLVPLDDQFHHAFQKASS